jgi:trimeric autotransporter adhesin
MKTLIFLFIVIFCPACASQSLPATEPSPAGAAATPLNAAITPASTPSPIESITPAQQLPSPTPIKMTTPTIFIPSPTPVFTILIDNAAIDQQGKLYGSGFSTGSDLRHYAVWAGGHWIELGIGFRTAGNTLVADGAGNLYTEILVDSELGTATAVMRWDGNRWEDITGGFNDLVDALKAGRVSSNIQVTAMAVDGEGNLYAAGMFYYPTPDNMSEMPMGYVARWDRESWMVLGQGLDMINVYGLAVSSGGNVYVSGEQPATPEGNNCYIAQFEAERWVQVNTGDLNWCSQGLVVDKNGHLYAAGESNTSGRLIVYWDTSDWTTIADQLRGEAPAVYDMAVDQESRLCIGGEFTSVSGILAENTACWDGLAWHALGEGVNERVFGLAFAPNGDLYAVGFFTEAGGLPAYHAARWDGVRWHALGDR